MHFAQSRVGNSKPSRSSTAQLVHDHAREIGPQLILNDTLTEADLADRRPSRAAMATLHRGPVLKEDDVSPLNCVHEPKVGDTDPTRSGTHPPPSLWGND